jgi:hypothetical protein
MNRHSRSTVSLLLAAALLTALCSCADLSASTIAAPSHAGATGAAGGNPANPLGERSTVNPLEPSPG